LQLVSRRNANLDVRISQLRTIYRLFEQQDKTAKQFKQTMVTFLRESKKLFKFTLFAVFQEWALSWLKISEQNQARSQAFPVEGKISI
jgi:hypothetical protein